MPNEPQLFVISGPSGTGKSTVLNAVEKRLEKVAFSISHTTRKPRINETDGLQYHFIDKKVFSGMIAAHKFVEWAEVYGEFYGTSFVSLKNQLESGLDILLDVDSQGAKNIKKNFEKSVLIYMLPPSIQTLRKRLAERGTDDEQTIKIRMDKTLDNIKECTWYDYIIINEDLEKAIIETQAIIVSERCRTKQKAHQIRRLFGIDFP